jgi:DNA-binding response OmpR family regulator
MVCATAQTDAVMPTTNLQGVRDVLIVEDDEAIRSLLLTTLLRESLSCDSAGDGVDGLTLLQAHSYAVMLLDVMMPRMGGLEMLERFRDLDVPMAAQPVVLLLTAVPNVDPLLPVAEMVHAIVKKPFDLQELVEIVCGCVTARRARDGVAFARAKRSGPPRGELS